MGRNKRDSSSVDDLNDSSDTQSEEIVSKPLKKLKREKRGGVEADVVNEEVGVKQLKKTKGVREKGVEDDEPEEEDGVSKPSKKSKKEKRDNGMENEVNPSVEEENMNPMERRKKRKTSDKLKHQTRLKSGDAPKVLKSVEGVSTNVPQLHLDVFKDLASSDSSIREAAAEALVTQLGSVQEAYEKVDKSGDEGGISPLEAEKDDGLKNCAPSLSYAIRRLIRGVSSSRECARQGFALGLTVVVSSIPCVNVDSLMKLITDLLEVSSSMKGQEVRECLLGRLFAYGALARSGKVADEWKSDKKTSCVKEFTSTIISLAAKKRYLQEPAVSVILDLVEKLPLEALLSQVFEAPGLQEWFHGALESGNPDALLLALKMREKVSTDNLVFGKLLPCPFSPNRLLTADHLSCLIPCFKESTFCQPRVHGVWAALINIILPSTTLQEEDATLGPSSTKKHKKNRKTNSSEEDIGKNVRSFCEIVVEGSLLVSSHDRKHLAFDILLLLLPRLPTSCVQIILSHKLVHCLMDILSTKDSWLFKAAEYFLKEITDWVRNDDERRVAVIVALQKHSSGRFDCITRTKTVKGLVGELNTGSGCMLFVQNLVSMFVDEEPEMDEPSDQSQTTDDNSELGVTNDKDLAGMESNPDFLKSWIINSLPCILKDVKLVPEAKILVQKEIMKFLAIQGLFSASLGTEVTSFDLKETFKWPKVATSSSLCQMCIEQLQLLIANAQKEKSVAVNSEKVEISPSFENNRDMNDLGSYFMHFIGAVCNIPSVSLFRRLSGEDDKAFKKLQAMEARLSAEETNMGPGTDANKMHALRYLMIQLLLQLILRPGEFHKATFELIICCTKAFPSCDILDSPDEDNVLDAGDAPTMVDVLVDTLLSLLPQSYPPVRSAVEQVFKFFCNDITDAGLISILKIVKSDLKPARHQTTDSEDDSDDDEDFLDINETEETDEGETINTAEDSNDEENESEITTRIDSSDEKLPEGSDDSDGGMDDDAMFRMDSYLARIFLEKKSQAAVGESPQSQLVLFKLRALSLLEIYLHENPGKTQVLTVFSYLVQSFLNLNTAEGSQQLEERIWGLLQKKILKAKKIPEGEDIQISTLESILKKSLKLATKPIKKKSATNSSNIKQLAFVSRQKKIFSLSQQSTYWVLKIVHARSLPESEKQRILDIFQLALMEFFVSKKSRLKPGFIKEVFQRQPWIGLRLFDFLLQKCRSVKSEFRRVDGVDMVEGILKFSVSSGEEKDAASERLKSHITPLTDLISKLVIDMPKKKLWRSQAFRFCGQAFKAIKALNLIKEFLEALTSEAYDACELQLGDIFHKFLPLNKPEKSTGTTKLKKSTETMKPDKSINKIKPKKSTDEKKSKKKIGREK